MSRLATNNNDMELISRLEAMGHYIDSLEWLVGDYIEDLQDEAPRMVRHIFWDLKHLNDECSQLVKDAYADLNQVTAA